MRSLFAFASVLALVSVGCSGVKTEPAANTGDVTIAEVVPAEGPLSGNVPVQIKGSGFTEENLLVTFGGTSVGDAEVVNSTTIRGTLPPHSQPGLVDVVVACAAGQATLSDGFEYREAAALSITGITPNNGPITGGTTVTITGVGFSGGATIVKFGANNGTGVNVVSDAQLTVLTPAAAANGPVPVAVTNDNGTTQLPNAFVYGDGGTTNPGTSTVTENLGGVAEFDRMLVNADPAYSAGQAFFFAASDVVYPANNTCALDLNQFPSVTSTLDAGAQVTMQQSGTSLALPKDASDPAFPIYIQSNGPETAFTLGEMAGVTAPGAAGVAAFNQAAVATAPSADYQAWLDPLGFSSFDGGGVWSNQSDLWISWEMTTTTDHIQIILVGSDMAGGQHVLQCDIRGGDTGGFCIKGGGANDICQTPGATMTDFYAAIDGPTMGFGASNVFLYRGNRSTFSLPGGATGALDVNVVRATSLGMF